MFLNRFKRSTIAPFLIIIGCCHQAVAEDLVAVYREAESNDTAIHQAQAALLAAEQRHRQSRSQLLPKADFTADTTHAQQKFGSSSNSTSTWGYGLSLTQPLFNRSNYDLLNQTDKLLAQAEAEYEAAKQNLIIRVAESYFNVLASQDNVDFSQSEIEANARQLEQTKQRFEVGLIAITDVHEAQAAHDLAIAREIVAKNELTSSIEALRELTGEYYDSFQGLMDKIPLTKPEPENPDAWVDLSLKNNLRIIAATFALESTRAGVKLKQADHLPTVDLIGRHNYNDNAGRNFNNESFTDTAILLRLNLPLYRGGGTVAQIKEAEQVYNQQLAELEKTRRNVQRQARDAYSSVAANISQVNALNQGIISTQSSLEASQAGLEVGTRTTVDVLNTRRELFRAQRDHSRARYDYIISTLRLREAAGSLSAENLTSINELLQ